MGQEEKIYWRKGGVGVFHSTDITDERFGGTVCRKVAFNKGLYQVGGARLYPEGMPIVGVWPQRSSRERSGGRGR